MAAGNHHQVERNCRLSRKCQRAHHLGHVVNDGDEECSAVMKECFAGGADAGGGRCRYIRHKRLLQHRKTEKDRLFCSIPPLLLCQSSCRFIRHLSTHFPIFFSAMRALASNTSGRSTPIVGRICSGPFVQ